MGSHSVVGGYGVGNHRVDKVASQRAGMREGLVAGVVLWHIVLVFLRPQYYLPPLGWIKLPLLFSLLPLLCLLTRPRERLPVQLKVMLLFLLLGGVVGVFAVNRAVAFHRWRAMVQLLLTVVFPAMLLLSGEHHLRKLVKVLVAIGLLLGTISVLSHGTGPGDFLADENDLCFALNFLLPFSLIPLLSTRGLGRRFLLLIATCALVGGIVATQSRGGFVGLIGMMGYLLLRSPQRGRIALLLALLGGGAATFAPTEYWSDMKTISQVNQGTAKSRQQFWAVALEVWLDPKNTVWGVGMGNTPYRLLEYQPPELDRILENRMWGRAVHSMYLQLLPDLGLLGGILFLTLVGRSFYDNSRAMKQITAWQRKSAPRAFTLVNARHPSSPAPPQLDTPPLQDDLQLVHTLLIATNTSWIGVLCTGAFISCLYYPPVWLLAAFSAVLIRSWRALEQRFTTSPPPAT